MKTTFCQILLITSISIVITISFTDSKVREYFASYDYNHDGFLEISEYSDQLKEEDLQQSIH